MTLSRSALACLLGCVSIASLLLGGTPSSAQQAFGGLVLVADDAATAANASNLVPTAVAGSAEARPVAGQTVRLPEGFSISVVAAGLGQPRFMLVDPAGSLLVADSGGGRVFRFAGADLPGADRPVPLLSGLDAPSSLAFRDGFLYVGETGAISRFVYDPASGMVGGRQVVVPDLPRGGHGTRTVVFGTDGTMFVSVGSSCNICAERDERRAAVARYNPDGSGYQLHATGLRNAVGLAIEPNSGQLWATINERDNQGNEIPPDLVTIVHQGDNFGWPGCQPPYAVPQELGNDCSNITPPTIGIQAHSAPLGLAFYTGQAFPSDYAGDLFVAQHGSWNRTPPAAPKLLRVHFEAGVPNRVQDFATGWQDASGRRWGRPVGLSVAPDGGLFVSDDQAGVVYKISRAAD
jgi:glucose/arabinose dehydrogenase